MPASDLFLPEPHFDTIGGNIAYQSKVVRGAGVVGQLDIDQKQDRYTASQNYRLLSSEDQKSFFDRLQELWFGGVSCYVPTYTNDFEVLANNSGLTLTVKANKFGTWYDDVCAQRVDLPWLYTSYGLMCITHDGIRHFFKLGNPANLTVPLTGPAEPGAYVDNLDGTATLYLKVSAGEALDFAGYGATQIKVCSLIFRARPTVPVIDLGVMSSAIVESQIAWTEVFFEAPFLLAPGTEGWAIPVKDYLGNVRGYWLMSTGNKMAVFSGGVTTYVNLTGAPPAGQMVVTLDSGTFGVNLTSL